MYDTTSVQMYDPYKFNEDCCFDVTWYYNILTMEQFLHRRAKNLTRDIYEKGLMLWSRKDKKDVVFVVCECRWILPLKM